ncbi:MerR HTH family regulatory protein [Reichenbachiella agariperforans]|uniref:MerR HTH family regulatory protein n=1 Tax=Reichenbachiella agariperforans TaxID=156994 RepID=A0A1M6JRT4_REIAG|nr:chaperone modulator CbpM [Reichenbachiella agariperforans]SHJ49373.1 MerR HTH family regulatory protein [Reichenbachiella agariperforans]
MPREDLIALEEICTHHNIATSFIHSLHRTGLIELITINDALFIDHKQLPYLEKYIDFHYKLDINVEGIESISHLLHNIYTLQQEVNKIKNRLQFYEPET